MPNSTKPTKETTKPLKATDKMSPQFSGYAEGRKPNVGGESKPRPDKKGT